MTKNQFQLIRLAKLQLSKEVEKNSAFSFAFRYRNIWFPENFFPNNHHIPLNISEFEGLKIGQSVNINFSHFYIDHYAFPPANLKSNNNTYYIAGFIPVKGTFTLNNKLDKNPVFQDTFIALSEHDLRDEEISPRVFYLRSQPGSILLFSTEAIKI